MATKEEIRDRAAEDLGIKSLVQDLQSQDSVRLETAYSEVYEDLKKDGLAVWAKTDEVPPQLVQYVSSLMAQNAAGTYGVSDQRFARIELKANTAKSEIKRLVEPDNISTERPEDF